MMMNSRSDRVHRKPSRREYRWMNSPDEVIPMRKPAGTPLRDYLLMMLYTFAMGAVLFSVWWFGG